MGEKENSFVEILISQSPIQGHLNFNLRDFSGLLNKRTTYGLMINVTNPQVVYSEEKEIRKKINKVLSEIKEKVLLGVKEGKKIVLVTPDGKETLFARWLKEEIYKIFSLQI